MDFSKYQVIDEVTQEDYLGFISKVFFLFPPATIPETFARSVSERSFDGGYGGARFGIVPTVRSEWGLVYETMSGRRLIWLPEFGGIVLIDLGESVCFKNWVESELGQSQSLCNLKSIDLSWFNDDYFEFIGRTDIDEYDPDQANKKAIVDDDFLARMAEPSFQYLISL